MLAAAYELEGLLLLAENRGEETSDMIYSAIWEKVEALYALTKHKIACMEQQECGDEAIGVTGWELKAATEDDIPQEEKNDSAEEQTEIPQIAGNGVREEENLPDEELPDETVEEQLEEAEPYDGSDIADDGWTEDEEADCAVDLRLDEALSRSRSKDLRAAFSLNDMFRFRRELFGNSAAEMTDAIHLVEAMSSFAEAEEYFYGDLGWDKDSEEVQEFMTIIKNHFL